MLNYSTQKNNFNFKAICHLGKKQYGPTYTDQLSGQSDTINKKDKERQRV